MKKFVLALIVSLIFSINAKAQTLEATVNRNPVPQGEAFILSLVLKDGQTNMTPDISPLNKDFKVYSVSNATNIQIINGKRSESTGQRRDIHEADAAYMERCHKAASYAADRLGWHTIVCYEGRQPLSKEEIAAKILEKDFQKAKKKGYSPKELSQMLKNEGIIIPAYLIKQFFTEIEPAPFTVKIEKASMKMQSTEKSSFIIPDASDEEL